MSKLRKAIDYILYYFNKKKAILVNGFNWFPSILMFCISLTHKTARERLTENLFESNGLQKLHLPYIVS